MNVILQLLQFVLANPTIVAELVNLVTSLLSHLKAAPSGVLQQVIAVLSSAQGQADIKKALADINTLLGDLKKLADDAQLPTPATK